MCAFVCVGGGGGGGKRVSFWVREGLFLDGGGTIFVAGPKTPWGGGGGVGGGGGGGGGEKGFLLGKAGPVS